MEKLPSKSTKKGKAQKSPVKHIVQDEPKPIFWKDLYDYRCRITILIGKDGLLSINTIWGEDITY